MPFAKNTANKGFTLIELMIVISIIGVLAALAIANYSAYEAKARQGEAKIALAAIFASERSFKGEFGSYIEDLKAIGYEPEGLKRHYTLGWKTVTNAAVVTGYTGGVGTPYFEYVNIPAAWGVDAGGVVRCDNATALGGLNDSTAAAGANPQAFQVKARGVLRPGVPCDEWEMNEDKFLRNTINSL